MKYRGKQYEQTIARLKELRAEMKIKGQRSEIRDRYDILMKQICGNFSISEKTIYRDMNKKIPGLRKTRNDQGKVRSKLAPGTSEKAHELMKAGQTKTAVKKRLKISEHKLRRASRKVSDTFRQNTGGQAAVSDTSASKFGSEAKKFFEKLFEYNLIAPDKGIGLKHNSVSFTVQKDDLQDVILILTNAYNRHCIAENKKLKLDRTELRSAMMQQLIEEQMRLAKESADYKLVEALTRMIDRLKEDAALPDDFGTFVKVCRELKADITEAEIIALIKKVGSDE